MFNPFKSNGSPLRLLNPIWWLMFLTIGLYRIPSKYLPNRCRFVPSCSTYAKDALYNYGAAKSCVLIVNRLRKCHPFHEGGFDPIVPKTPENPTKIDEKN